jgi:hypothetical protein
LSREDLEKSKILKMITPEMNEKTNSEKIDQNFSDIIIVKSTPQDVEKGLKQNNLTVDLKSSMFDSLKRCDRFETVTSSILNYTNRAEDEWGFMSRLEERDLLGGLIQTVNVRSRAKLGTLIAKNDYPLPLLFSTYDFQTDSVTRELTFELFDNVLCLTSKSLCVVSGTRSAAFKGKSSLIPYLFDGLHPTNSVFKSKTNNRFQWNNVDVLCNENTLDKWIIADFHSQVESQQATNLLRSFGAYASMHLINVTIEDFDQQTGHVRNELRDLLKWYSTLNPQLFSSTHIQQPLIILIIRDYSAEQYKGVFPNIKQNLLEAYRHVVLLTLNNISDENETSRPFKIQNIIDALNEQMNKRELFQPRSMHSINDIKRFYESLNRDENFKGIFN